MFRSTFLVVLAVALPAAHSQVTEKVVCYATINEQEIAFG